MTPQEQFLAVANAVPLQKADAVILLQGDGFFRIEKACLLIKEGWADVLVFSGGNNDEHGGSFSYARCKDVILASGVVETQIIVEDRSTNTREQAEQIISLCESKGWKSIVLVASHYHQFRAFLTFLKVLSERALDRSIHIRNAPAYPQWFSENSWGKRIDLLERELEKIERYRNFGHISSYEDALCYFEYMEKQSCSI